MSNDLLTLSLVIPTYNQRARTARSAVAASEFLRARFPDRAELIVVDDGSLPGQAVESGDLPSGTVLVRHQRNLGKGGAVRSGVIKARGSYIVFTDSDLPFSLEPITTTLEWLRDGADIVIGERQLDLPPAIAVTRMRQLSSILYTWMVHHLLGLDYPDIQCGYKGYRAAVAKDLFGRLEVTSFAFEAEILLLARGAGCRIRRQPLRLVHNEDSSVRLTRHAPQMLSDTLCIAWRRQRGVYGPGC